MDDIRRPGAPMRRPQPRPLPQAQPLPQPLPQQPQPLPLQPQPTVAPPEANPQPVHAPQPIDDVSRTPLQKPRRKKAWLWVLLSLLVFLVVSAGIGWFVYQDQLAAVDPAATDRIQVTIAPGTSPSAIGQQLKDEDLIKSTEIFALYTRITETQNILQAGSYHLSRSETLPQIVDHLVGGKVDSFNITFLPGATLAENRQVLIDAGYTALEVDTALKASYTSALFQDRPLSADLEGYIYGETYQVSSGATVEEILQQTFTEYEKVIAENNLVAGFAAQNLTLYQGITLASIIQRESIGGDESQIAQVFYTRLAMGMELGSDVTYQYIADKLGVTRSPDLDSPYNTRKYAGLPPGPIAAPGLAALKAVAAPAAGDYVYFLSGDDDVTYFARTLEEHEANISTHCQLKCQIL